MNSEQNRAVYSFYFESGLRDLIPIYPLYAVMFTEHGLSTGQVSMLFGFWSLMVIVTEVPSGTLADMFSKKILIVLGSILKSLAFVAWFSWQNFYGYLCGFLLWGLSSSLRSGAWETMLYQLLFQWNRPEEFTKIYGRATALGNLSSGAAQFLGGLLIVLGYDWVLLVSAILPVIGVIPFILFVQENRADTGITSSSTNLSFREVLSTGINEALHSTILRFILLFQGGLIVFYECYDEFVALFLREKGFSLQHLAYVCALIYISGALGRYFANRFTRAGINQLLISLALAGGLLFIAATSHPYLVIVLLCAFFFLFGANATIMASLLQHQIQSSARATVTSVAKMFEEVNAIPLFLLFGWIANQWQTSGGTQVFAIIILVVSLIMMVLARRWKIPQNFNQTDYSHSA